MARHSSQTAVVPTSSFFNDAGISQPIARPPAPATIARSVFIENVSSLDQIEAVPDKHRCCTSGESIWAESSAIPPPLSGIFRAPHWCRCTTPCAFEDSEHILRTRKAKDASIRLSGLPQHVSRAEQNRSCQLSPRSSWPPRTTMDWPTAVLIRLASARTSYSPPCTAISRTWPRSLSPLSSILGANAGG